ncbi:hypothetical protein B0J11DRAFT_500574 [Dendryphion nanum]|uniref:Protein SQS1 n=1 Tax=Dendryphion nanum TaxID=256645 RepID=A0A9P9IWL7_9PLEO|nr:hypothetical protein B0J11DRAFT_500574 [Dendryphion nanum]
MATHRSQAFDSEKRLRDRKVTFVSAGYLEGTIKENIREDPFLVQEPYSPLPTIPTSELDRNIDTDMDHQPPEPANAMARMTIRSPCPAPSTSSLSSSEDEVIFCGRGVTTGASITTTTTKTTPGHQTNESATGMESLPSGSSPISGLGTESDGESIDQQLFAERLKGESKWTLGTTPWVSRSKPGIGWLPVSDRPDMNAFLDGRINPRDAAMEDYMQNVRDSFSQDEPTVSSSFARRPIEIGDHESDGLLPRSVVHQSDSWDSDLLHDLDNLSTSSDVIDIIERIVATRKRRSGVQYLVVYEGSTTDDTHWLPLSFFKTEKELQLIQVFETKRTRHNTLSESSDDSSFDDQGSDDEEEDDTPVYSGMAADGESDEAYAARLQKELDYDAETGIMYGDDIYIAHTAPPDRQWTKRKSRNREPIFPSASALADAIDQDPYGAFDIMDTERPSLRPKKKGRRGHMPPELDDPDLNEQMHRSWENDRAKKRLKKAEREEQRKLGLLGRKGKGPDLSVKYKQGANMNEITEDIRDFLFSDMTTLSLPPMEAKHRAVIHQFVHKFGLSSKSRGAGANRFTILSKTLRTIKVDDDEFEAISEQRRFKTRLTAPARHGPKTRPIVSYKDGDTVGASAPELGPENKGRRLLEKMGWTKGTALGALDNKGILQPIAHTVKMTKAGLQ